MADKTVTTKIGGYVPTRSMEGDDTRNVRDADSGYPTWSQNYADTWRTVQQQLTDQRGPADLFTNLLSNYRGGQDLTDFLDWAAPFMASSLYDNQGAQYLRDPSNWDNSAQAYGQGAGLIGQQAAAVQQQGQQDLARMGLGRSGAMAGLANQTAMSAAGQQANLFTQLNQQGLQNRLQGARASFDTDRAIMNLALGYSPQPRMKQSNSAGIAGALGQGLGALGGAAIGALAGPAGAAAGGASGLLGAGTDALGRY